MELRRVLKNWIYIYAVIILLAVQMFRIDGSFCIEKSHMRFAETNNLASTDMKNIFLSKTNNRISGTLFDSKNKTLEKNTRKNTRKKKH